MPTAVPLVNTVPTGASSSAAAIRSAKCGANGSADCSARKDARLCLFFPLAARNLKPRLPPKNPLKTVAAAWVDPLHCVNDSF